VAVAYSVAVAGWQYHDRFYYVPGIILSGRKFKKFTLFVNVS
jgi:hypothetical protein